MTVAELFKRVPKSGIEDEFLPKAPNWGDCYCKICVFILDDPEFIQERVGKGMSSLSQCQHQVIKHRPTKLCIPLWKDWYKLHGDIPKHNWQNETINI